MENSKNIQELTNVYTTMLELEVKGKYCTPYAICLQKIEEVIKSMQLSEQQKVQNVVQEENKK